MTNQTTENLSQNSADYAANMEKITTSDNEAEIKDLLEKNLKYAKAIYWSTEKIRRYIFWQRIFGLIKILIIVVPLIFAAIYLPPLLQGLFAPYAELLKK